MKNFGEKEAWVYLGTAQFLRVPPIISGTGKETDFKLCMHICLQIGSERGASSFAVGYLLIMSRVRFYLLSYCYWFHVSISF